MSGNNQKNAKPAIIFGSRNISRIGYIDDFIFAGEVKGGNHIIYRKARRPAYHLVIMILEGEMSAIINGREYRFRKNSYLHLPTWSEISEIEYGENFHALMTATDSTIIDDIFKNRTPFPPEVHFRMVHSIHEDILTDKEAETLCKDISDLIRALGAKDHNFMKELCYSYFYIMLTDMADMTWKKYGSGFPSHTTDMSRSGMLMKKFIQLLAENIETQTSVSFYAGKLCISNQYLALIVKNRMGSTVSNVISSLRADRAARLLREPELSIQQIASRLSFSDQSSFGKFFRKHHGMSPMKYRSSLRKTLLSLRQGDGAE